MLAVAGRAARCLAMSLALGVAAPALAVPISLVVDGGWQTFTATGGLGPIDSPADGYTITSATPIEIQVVDCCVIGDRYEIFVNDVSYTVTSTVAPADYGVPSSAFNGPDAWADARLSRVSFVLAAGTYDIDLSVIANVASTSGGFIQALTSVPEPDALVLLAVGLAGLFWMSAPRRRAQASARPSRPNK